MTQFSYEIKDAAGIHARPAGLLVKLAGTFQSDITIECGGKKASAKKAAKAAPKKAAPKTEAPAKASAKKLFAVMGMGIKCGSAVTVTAEGADESEAAKQLETFFKENL